MTFGELFARYLERHSKVHKKSWRQDESRYRNRLVHWAGRRLSSISKAEVQTLHARIGAESGGAGVMSASHPGPALAREERAGAGVIYRVLIAAISSPTTFWPSP